MNLAFDLSKILNNPFDIGWFVFQSIILSGVFVVVISAVWGLDDYKRGEDMEHFFRKIGTVFCFSLIIAWITSSLVISVNTRDILNTYSKDDETEYCPSRYPVRMMRIYSVYGETYETETDFRCFASEEIGELLKYNKQ